MKLNTSDGVTYCTNSERLAKSAEILANTSLDTSKYYELDTKTVWIVYNSTWYQL